MATILTSQRLATRANCCPHLLTRSRLVISSASPRSLSTSRPSRSPEALSTTSSNTSSNRLGKTETIPFHLSPEDARDRLDEAGASAFGVTSVFSLLWSRFLKRWGLGGGQAGGAQQLAMRALLLPTWRVDIALKGKGLIGDSQMHLSGVSCSL